MKAEDIKKRYAKSAMNYDEMSMNDKYNAYKIMSLWALENIGEKKAKILDLGCGTGLSSIEFFKGGHRVIGVDISKEMLKKAEKYPFEKLICQDIEDSLDFKDNTFDVVMLIGVIEFIRSPLQLFKNIRKILKDEGIFLITVPRKLPDSTKLPFKSYTEDEINNIFLKAKFKIVESKSFLGYFKQTETEKESVYYLAYLLRK